jgi:hypothetical protein
MTRALERNLPSRYEFGFHDHYLQCRLPVVGKLTAIHSLLNSCASFAERF